MSIARLCHNLSPSWLIKLGYQYSSVSDGDTSDRVINYSLTNGKRRVVVKKTLPETVFFKSISVKISGIQRITSNIIHIVPIVS